MTEPREPTVAEYMTSLPYTIGRDQTLDAAQHRMRELEVRHLPVLHGGNLVGILSERDIAMVETLPGVDGATITVDEAMSSEVYTVSVDARLKDVAQTMADRKLGAALVLEGEALKGVFTTTDALAALAARLP